MKKIILLLICSFLSLSACSLLKTQSLPTEVPTATCSATATSSATSTPTVTNTYTPLPTDTPTETQTPTSTSTFTPTIMPATFTPKYTPKPRATSTPSGKPGILISLPNNAKWPSNGIVSGKVTGINPTDYNVAVYIKVNDGWWTKPFFNAPLTRIAANGYWESAFITGGEDEHATDIRAYLVPKGKSVPAASGGGLPGELEAYLMAEISR
jgi:hypothetical protein